MQEPIMTAQAPTPLQALMQSAHFTPEGAMTLVRLSANPHTILEDGTTLLHKLVKTRLPGWQAAVTELVKTHGVKIDQTDKDGLTAFAVLIGDRFEHEDALLLLRLGANPNVKNMYGVTFIHILVDYNNKPDRLGLYGSNTGAIKELVNKMGADINIADKRNRTALARVLDEPHIYADGIVQLLALGATLPTYNSAGVPVLHSLVGKNRVEAGYPHSSLITKLVQNYNVNVDCKNASERTALQEMLDLIPMGDPSLKENAMLLIRLGANKDTKDKLGQNILQLLVSLNKATSSFLSLGLTFTHGDAITELVTKHGMNLNQPNAHNKKPLQSLLDSKPEGWQNLAMFLIRLGADPQTTDSNGNTFFTLLAMDNGENKHFNMMKELREKYNPYLNSPFYQNLERIVKALRDYANPSLSAFKPSWFTRQHTGDAQNVITSILEAKSYESVEEILKREINSQKEATRKKVEAEAKSGKGKEFDLSLESDLQKSGYYKALVQGINTLREVTNRSSEQDLVPTRQP